MAITAGMVKELREMTGAGMMDCKKALSETNGDMDAAVEFLRKNGQAKAEKKAGRIAAEGIVKTVVKDDKVAAIVEVNSETDFVAKNDEFQGFVEAVVNQVVDSDAADMDAFMDEKWAADESLTVKEALSSEISIIGENMNIRRFVIVDGILSTYIHGKGTTGVIISFDADDAAVQNPGFPEFAKNIALQVAAMPVSYLNKESVPESVLAEEKEILMTQIKNDEKMANKPEAIIEKMVLGRIGKFYENNCLLDQHFVKDTDKTIQDLITEKVATIGEKISVRRFVRYEMGEGLENSGVQGEGSAAFVACKRGGDCPRIRLRQMGQRPAPALRLGQHQPIPRICQHAA